MMHHSIAVVSVYLVLVLVLFVAFFFLGGWKPKTKEKLDQEYSLQQHQAGGYGSLFGDGARLARNKILRKRLVAPTNLVLLVGASFNSLFGGYLN